LTTLEVVLAYTAQLLLYEKYPDTWAGIGVLLVVAGGVIMILHGHIINMWTVNEALQPEYEPLLPPRPRQRNQNVTYTYIQ